MEKILVNETNLHQNLLLSKQLFISIKEDLNKKKSGIEERINTFEREYNSNKKDLEGYRDKNEKIIENLISIEISIKNEIINKRKEENKIKIEIPALNVSSLISDKILKTIDRSFQAIINIEKISKEEIESIYIIINVEAKTSLDLLFVMDITGSMQPYIEEAKENLINIINRIINQCPGIDINLGFIGYRDIEEVITGDYIDIDFTKNYEYLQNCIKNSTAYGGADTPEDVAWAFEMAITKSWKNNAKFIVFVADAPCHGIKCHNSDLDESYPDGIPGREDIEEIVKDIAEANISLFCMQITDLTKKMFELFKNIYKEYNYTEFYLINMNSEKDFTDMVVDSAIKVYISQRNIDF